ncbi:MAG: hypothetical protein J7K54_04265, partial [Candidatus Aenigmarchaeota archaeon]|nr:hypothetical protein [Candidatus Aenigmarchaeota archaeon]
MPHYQYHYILLPLILTILLTSGCLSNTHIQTNQTASEPPPPPPIPQLPSAGSIVSAGHITGMTSSTQYPGFAQPESFTLPDTYTFTDTADTQSISLTITDSYIYRYAFISYSGQPWQQVTLSGPISTQYITGSATATIPITPSSFGLTAAGQSSSNNYIVTYTCNSAGDCHDGWQIEQFTVSIESELPPPQTSGTIYYVSSSLGDDSRDGLTPQTAW